MEHWSGFVDYAIVAMASSYTLLCKNRRCDEKNQTEKAIRIMKRENVRSKWRTEKRKKDKSQRSTVIFPLFGSDWLDASLIMPNEHEIRENDRMSE